MKGVIAVSDAMSAMASLVTINCLTNPIGDDGLATLVTAVEGSSVRSNLWIE